LSRPPAVIAPLSDPCEPHPRFCFGLPEDVEAVQVELLGVEGENPQARGPAQLEFGLAERAFSRALVRLEEGFALPGRSAAPVQASWNTAAAWPAITTSGSESTLSQS
jgi:hypothetical protein